MPKIRTGRMRLVLFIYRKPGMSLEDFQTYWRDEHFKVFRSVPIVKKNLLNYEQVGSRHPIVMIVFGKLIYVG